MKKGIRILILSIVIIFILLPFSVSAWRPDYSFRCSVDNYLMPDNTVYIDLLMPISVNDDAYIDFNDKKGNFVKARCTAVTYKYQRKHPYCWYRSRSSCILDCALACFGFAYNCYLFNNNYNKINNCKEKHLTYLQ